MFPEPIRAAMLPLFGERVIRPGRVELDLPTIAETGASVPMTVNVPPGSDPGSRAVAIYVFAERNPQPHVGRFRFGPRAASTRVTTRIRLAAAQTVVAVAECADGSLWSASVDINLGFAACMDPG
jgi:sulfur-oxidizing protein SoxY